jgi:hypothetical protein
MKIVVLNYTGSVGKTMIATHLLSPRMGGAPIIALESINFTSEGSGLSVEQFKGAEFWKLFSKLLATDDTVVDVGTSNIEDFLAGMRRFEGSHIAIDYFIVPVTGGTKEQRGTIGMITSLANLGVPANRIRILFNRVNESVQDEFRMLLNYVEKNNNATANLDAAIFDNELFDVLADENISMKALLEDTTDYKAMLLNNKAKDPEIRDYCGGMLGLILLARATDRYLDEAFVAVLENP